MEFAFPNAIVHPIPAGVTRPAWIGGKPVAIVNHFTAVCDQDYPGFGRFAAESIGSPFGIRRDGTVCQYADLDVSTWHAYGRSKHAVGIELAANPTKGCAPMAIQLQALAELNAWLCETFDIPVVRSRGQQHSDPGIGCHTDGRQPGADWNPNSHWDAPWKAAGDQIAAFVTSSLAGS